MTKGENLLHAGRILLPCRDRWPWRDCGEPLRRVPHAISSDRARPTMRRSRQCRQATELARTCGWPAIPSSAGRRAVEIGAEYAPVHVFPITGRQRLPLGYPERSPPVSLPLGAEEQRGLHSLDVEALRQVEQMSDEEHLDAACQQRPDDLPGDLRAFPLVGRSERLVAQQDAARGYLLSSSSSLPLSMEASSSRL